MLGGRRFAPLALFFVCFASGAACKEEEDRGILQDADFKVPEGLEFPFDRNTIVTTASLIDVDGIDGAAIQKFLHKTPYDRASFLETYQSNGVRASDAIARAARTYRINPLVFLVEAQTTEGLLGEANYPFPPERVEYVFRCGCLEGGNNCLPELAGFDRQVDCLGRKYRVAVDQIVQNEQTARGWGKDKTSLTLDNVKVTPTTEGTAAVYDHRPRVADGEAGGTWVFWNVWNVYATAIDYAGPIGGANGGGWIGDRCASATGCGFERATCATNYPGGLCTTACTGDCPGQPDKPESFCADFKTNGGFCLTICNPGAPACREGYKCLRLKRLGAVDVNDSKYVCTLP
jgi:hypothetical protein